MNFDILCLLQYTVHFRLRKKWHDIASAFNNGPIWDWHRFYPWSKAQWRIKFLIIHLSYLGIHMAPQNFKQEIFLWNQADSYSLRKRNAEKCENHQNWTTFKGSYWASKFWYIIRLCEIGQNSKIDSFKVFHFKLYFHVHNHKSS